MINVNLNETQSASPTLWHRDMILWHTWAGSDHSPVLWTVDQSATWAGSDHSPVLWTVDQSATWAGSDHSPVLWTVDQSTTWAGSDHSPVLWTVDQSTFATCCYLRSFYIGTKICLQLATFEMWCWSGGRGIIIKTVSVLQYCVLL